MKGPARRSIPGPAVSSLLAVLCPGQHPGPVYRRRYPWGAGSWPATSQGRRRSIPGPALSLGRRLAVNILGNILGPVYRRRSIPGGPAVGAAVSQGGRRLCAAAQCRRSLPRAGRRSFRQHPWGGRRSIPGPPISRYPWGAGGQSCLPWAGNIPGPAVDRQHPGQLGGRRYHPCLPSLRCRSMPPFFAQGNIPGPPVSQGRPPFFPATSLGGRAGRRGSIPGQHPGQLGAGGIIPACRLCAAAQCRRSLPRATSLGRQLTVNILGAGAAVSQGNIPGPPISRYPWGAGGLSQGNIPGPAVDRQHPGQLGAGGIIPACRLCAAAQCRYSLPRATSQGRRYPRAGRRSFRQHPWGAGPAGAAVSQGNILGNWGPAVSSLLAVFALPLNAAVLCPGQHPRAADKPVSLGGRRSILLAQGRQHPRAGS